MSYSKYYNPTNWENYPSEDTAVNAMHLNNLEDGVDTLDDRIVALSTDKSEVSWNQTLISGEKIAEITVNGITKDVYAPEISDSVVEQAAEQALKSEGYAVGTQGDIPVTSGLYYHNNAKYYSEQSSGSATEAASSANDAEADALVSEGWAVGEQNGVPVEEGSPYYHNNSKYWSEQSNPTRFSSLSDVNFGTLEDGDIPVYDATSQKWVNEVGVSTDLITNTTGEFDTRTGGILGSCKITLSPKQSGSGTPSPQNVRPITGHTAVEVGNTSENLFSLLTKDTNKGYVDNYYLTTNGSVAQSGGYYISEYLEVNPNKIYYISGLVGNSPSLCYYDSNKTFISGVQYANQSNILDTTPINAKYMRLSVLKANESSYAVYDTIPQTYTISLGQTVYGGSVDVVSGVLTVDKGYAEFDGSNDEMWYSVSGSASAFARGIDIADIVSYSITQDNSLIINNELPVVLSSATWGNYDYFISKNNGLKNIVAGIKTITTEADFRDWLSSNPLQIVYWLATPLTIQLTPQQIETLIGQNNVSVPLDGQSLDSLTYREVLAWDDVERAVSVKLDLSSVAPIEYTDKASQSYNQKQLFIKDNKLCQALASISSGASFTENTNFKYTTLAEIIEPLIP